VISNKDFDRARADSVGGGKPTTIRPAIREQIRSLTGAKPLTAKPVQTQPTGNAQKPKG
jgi:hypothetical protein